MTFVITGDCVDIMDRSCVAVCPVDCIYTGGRKLYVNPAECIECGACETECPVDSIMLDGDVEADHEAHVADNAAFFYELLPGREAPLGDPGGAARLGPVPADTPMVAALPVREP